MTRFNADRLADQTPIGVLFQKSSRIGEILEQNPARGRPRSMKNYFPIFLPAQKIIKNKYA